VLATRSKALGPLALFSGIALPWPLFATVYYGTPLPQTALTKFQRVGLLQYLMHELSYPSVRLLWPGAGVSLAWLALLLAITGAVRLWRAGVWQLPLHGALHAAAYLYLRPFLAHGWHLYPWCVAFCVCSAVALAPLPARAEAAPPPSAASWLVRLRRGLGWCACAGLLGIAASRFPAEARFTSAGYWTGQRDAVYRRIAGYLRSRAQPGDMFAAVEVGTIAYYSGLPAYDLGGLVTRLGEARPPRALRFLVLDKLYLDRAPASAPLFAAREGDFSAQVYAVESDGDVLRILQQPAR